ncbi:MAG: alpha/beta hydrolase [Bacillota bacterium]
MNYKFIDKGNKLTICLLHGTGGDEEDLIFLGELMDKKANILGLRGNIVENGMNRFFKRIAPGILDEESLKKETKNLYSFLKEFSEDKGLSLTNFIFLGFSNGANILASLLFHFGNIFKANILLHPMRPFTEFNVENQAGALIYLTGGLNDKITPLNEIKKLANIFKENNANVTLNIYKYGHQLSEKEIKDLKSWYKKAIKI